jgi:hypothetical protein
MRVREGMLVTNGLVFENQTILAGRPPLAITNLEYEPSGLPFH